MASEISRASLVSKRNSDLHYKRASVGFLVLTCVILFNFGLELLFVFLCCLTVFCFVFLSVCDVFMLQCPVYVICCLML